MKYLHEQDYYTVTPAEAYKILAQNKVPKKHKKLVMVTFDDGYENNYTAAYPLLKKYHIHATIGLITSKVDTQGMLTLKQVKEMKKSKWVSFVSHTQNHQELNRLDEAGQREEM
ncbi:polysaccharide deacetylase family protein [Ligilactobacillus animalis]|nr:polysaccharide deacetylase family protein [Ligilactobacillus animalis]MDQ2233961.1 polysaccharide deacetylase family protein [Ligilactobacillus animalis]MDU1486981.1 polysaccharide deacetylase family protein [Ligilactobacillus animalis]WHQ80789.1 polysaccharide deacetylase family protein [Ligilactobacillus animalis]